MIYIILFCCIYLAIPFVAGTLAASHVFVLAAVLTAYLLHKASREFLFLIFPFVIYAYLYDFTRLIPFSFLAPIHVSDIYAWEIALFGFRGPSGPVPLCTLFEPLNIHILECISAFFYTVFLPVVPAMTVYLWRKRSSSIAQRFMISFFMMNVVAHMTQTFFPVAAPWYVSKYGFASPATSIAGDPAGLVYIEQWLGIDLYTPTYQSSAIVFGAFPSMHAGIAALSLFYVIVARKKGMSVVMTLYFLGMCFSAVYLQHHYVIDLIAGILYALATFFVVERYMHAHVVSMYRWIFSLFSLPRIKPLFPVKPRPQVASEQVR